MLKCWICSTIHAYAHCNSCNENGDNSSIWNEDGLQIAAGPDPIIIMKPTDKSRQYRRNRFRETEKTRRRRWEGKNDICSIDIIVKYIQSQLEKNAQRPARVAVLDSPLLHPSIPLEFTFIAGVVVHKVFHGWDLTASDAKNPSSNAI